MTLDQLARNAADELVSAGREARFTSQPPPVRRNLSTSPAVVLAALVAVLAIGLPVLFLTGDDQASEVGSGGTETTQTASTAPSTAVAGFLELAGETFSVGDQVEAFSEAPMYESTLPDTPAFDTSAFGAELPLTQGQPMVADPNVIDGAAVYIGEIGADSAFLTQEVRFSEDGDEYHQKCLWIGPSPQLCADYGKIAVHPAGEPVLAVWLGVPDGTVAVAAFEDGEPVGWQRPRSRVAVLSVGSGDVTLIALGSDGQEIISIQRVPAYEVDTERVPGVTTTQPGS